MNPRDPYIVEWLTTSYCCVPDPVNTQLPGSLRINSVLLCKPPEQPGAAAMVTGQDPVNAQGPC